jgi:hypothetical protein
LGPWAKGIIEHHERWDGTGYPRGLSGHQISLAGRVIAVADSYEVMTATRSYKKPMSVKAAREELTRAAGTHFDPAMVRVFLSVPISRVRWTAGPIAWVAQLPFLAQIPTWGATAVMATSVVVSAPLVTAVAESAVRPQTVEVVDPTLPASATSDAPAIRVTTTTVDPGTNTDTSSASGRPVDKGVPPGQVKDTTTTTAPLDVTTTTKPGNGKGRDNGNGTGNGNGGPPTTTSAGP